MKRIGIVGLGFVGTAIKNSLRNVELVLVDSDVTKNCHGTYNDLLKCDGIFVCVPSPQSIDGSCNTSILEDVLQKLSLYTKVIISKCTVPPTIYKNLSTQYVNLVHAPEFLTAANANNDYINGKFAFIGSSNREFGTQAEDLIRLSQPNLEKVFHCSIGEASLAKYTINSFLATKVIFMNEVYQLANKLKLDYNIISQMISSDLRIGASHLQVPGHDGQFGFGGMCFPKDTAALLKFAEEVDQSMNVLAAAIETNTLLRLQNQN